MQKENEENSKFACTLWKSTKMNVKTHAFLTTAWEEEGGGPQNVGFVGGNDHKINLVTCEGLVFERGY